MSYFAPDVVEIVATSSLHLFVMRGGEVIRTSA